MVNNASTHVVLTGQGTSQLVHSLVSIQQDKSFHWWVQSTKRSPLIGRYTAPRDRVLVSRILPIVSLYTHPFIRDYLISLFYLAFIVCCMATRDNKYYFAICKSNKIDIVPPKKCSKKRSPWKNSFILLSKAHSSVNQNWSETPSDCLTSNDFWLHLVHFQSHLTEDFLFERFQVPTPTTGPCGG